MFFGHLEHFTAIWYILCSIGNLVVIWYVFPRSGTLCQEKSGNPVSLSFILLGWQIGDCSQSLIMSVLGRT
jgi:hypothetical protein